MSGSAPMNLLNAFQLFQEHSDRLEASHQRLQEQLAMAELELARRHEELQHRVQQVEEMRERLDGIIESIADAVMLVDADGRIEVANASAQELLTRMGHAAESLAPLPWIASHLAAGQPVRDHQVNVEIGRAQRNLLVSVLPMRGMPRDRGKRMVVVLRDITERCRLEQQLAREDRLAALGRVAANVAHEVRNPLSAIEGFARLLERDLREQPDSSRLAAMIVQAARQLNSVVTNLLNYTRDVPCRPGLVDLAALLDELASLYAPVACDLGITLTVEVEERPLPQHGDPVQLRQAVTNLLINAMDACPIRGEGRVVLSACTDGEERVITVTDNGHGIAEEVLPQIFDPFFTHKDGGVGLGLALCRRIVEFHGGRNSVRSAVGEGTTMTIHLPFNGSGA